MHTEVYKRQTLHLQKFAMRWERWYEGMPAANLLFWPGHTVGWKNDSKWNKTNTCFKRGATFSNLEASIGGTLSVYFVDQWPTLSVGRKWPGQECPKPLNGWMRSFSKTSSSTGWDVSSVAMSVKSASSVIDLAEPASSWACHMNKITWQLPYLAIK